MLVLRSIELAVCRGIGPSVILFSIKNLSGGKIVVEYR
jgi:hypothetical protein